MRGVAFNVILIAGVSTRARQRQPADALRRLLHPLRPARDAQPGAARDPVLDLPGRPLSRSASRDAAAADRVGAASARCCSSTARSRRSTGSASSIGLIWFVAERISVRRRRAGDRRRLDGARRCRCGRAGATCDRSAALARRRERGAAAHAGALLGGRCAFIAFVPVPFHSRAPGRRVAARRGDRARRSAGPRRAQARGAPGERVARGEPLAGARQPGGWSPTCEVRAGARRQRRGPAAQGRARRAGPGAESMRDELVAAPERARRCASAASRR